MRALPVVLPLLALACGQDVHIATDKVDPPDPIDTDIGVAIDQPAIQVTPNKLPFGELPPGCPTSEQVFTIKNVGTAPLEVSAFDFAGPVSAYTLDKTGPFTLAPDDEVDVSVAFTAAALADYNVRVNITSNDPVQPTTRVLLTGAGSQSAFREEVFVQESADSVDVLWVIDTSCSMESYINTVANAMGQFIQGFVNLGLDYHIGVVTTDMELQSESGRFRGPWFDNTEPNGVNVFRTQSAVNSSGSANEMGFGASRAALTAPLISQGDNAGFLRDDATLAVVVVSDEDDRYATVEGTSTVYPARTDAYVTWFQSMKADPNDVSFSALTCGNTAMGCSQYHRAIGATRGVWGNINKDPIDITPFLTQLSFVASGLNVAYGLLDVPTNTSPSAITVTIDGVAVPFDPSRTNGWTYDSDTNSIVFWGDSIPDPGEAIVIHYPYDAGC